MKTKLKIIDAAIIACAFLYAGLVVYYTLTGFDGRIRLTTVLVPLGLILHCLYKKDTMYERFSSRVNWVIFFIFLGVSILSLVYLWTNYNGLIYERAGDFIFKDYLIGFLSFVAIAEVVRKDHGNTILVIILIFIIYCIVGPWMPGFLYHGGISLTRLISTCSVEMNQGIWGLLPQVGATWITMFILLASVAKGFGCLDALMNACMVIPKYIRYGVPQTAVVSSLVIGGFSGSAAANVAATGAFTIPLMKKHGIPGSIAGAIEAVVSTGGQVLPPIMGAGVFLMVEFLGVRYMDLMIVGIAPGLLFFCMTSLAVYFISRKYITPISKVEAAKFKFSLNDLFLILPLIAAVSILILMLGYFMMGIMISGFSATLALIAGQAIIAAILYFKGDPAALKNYPKQLMNGVLAGVKESANLVLLLSLMGVIVAVLNVTGFTLKITTTLTEAAGANLPYLIALVSMVCFLFGMGVPTVAAYLMVAIMAAPALLDFGIDPLVSHFFVFYLAVLSGITPPVALNVAVASRISHESFWETSWHAVKIGTPLFILPILFLIRPDILSGDLKAVLPFMVIGIGLSAVIFGLFGLENDLFAYIRRFSIFLIGLFILFYLKLNFVYLVALILLVSLMFYEILRIIKYAPVSSIRKEMEPEHCVGNSPQS